MKDYRLTIRLSAEMRRRLKNTAHRNGTRESEIVRGAVERQFAGEDQEMSAYERAKKAGLIGAVKGASRDLSTNPKYFDGFAGS
jgi:predicted DNA-binding protein